MNSLTRSSWKALAGLGAGLAMVAGGMVAASAATTEDDFGQQVKQEVVACKASAARTDSHGIGQCVSAWVKAHNPSSSARTEQPEPKESQKPEPAESPEAADDNGPKDAKDDAKDAKPAHPVKPAGSHGRSGR